MTRTEALIELRDKVQAGSIPVSDLDAFIPVFGITTPSNDAHMAYRGSLDAAKALRVSLYLPVPELMRSDARAELLDILNALIAQEQGK